MKQQKIIIVIISIDLKDKCGLKPPTSVILSILDITGVKDES